MVFLAGIALVIALFINLAYFATVAALAGCAAGVYFAFLSPFINPPRATPAPVAPPPEQPVKAG